MMDDSIPAISCDEYHLDDATRDQRIAKFVVDELAPLIPHRAHIIGFDGFDGVGKSTIAQHLAEKLGLQVIGLDGFLEKNRGAFFDALNFDKLEDAIGNALTLRGKLIIEGCLIADVLERIGRPADFRAYVMKTTCMASSPEAEWIRERDILFGDQLTAELIAEREELAKCASRLPERFGGGGSGNLPSLERELILYHRERRPHDRANVIIKIEIGREQCQPQDAADNKRH